MCIWVVFSLFFSTKNAHGRTWVMIFNHDIDQGGYFNNFSDAMYSLNPHKYSIFQLISPDFITDGYFEFLLEYPDVSGFNQWRQDLLPWNNTEVNDENAKGYQGISISWNASQWGGLVLSNNYYSATYNVSTLLDGSAGHVNWWYAIGCINPSSLYEGFMPGPNELVKKACLWMRIDKMELLIPQSNINQRKRVPSIRLLFAFCSLFH